MLINRIPWFDYKEEKSKTDIYLSNRDTIKLSPEQEIKELDLAWFNFFIKDSKNGHVLISNTYKKDFEKIRLIHLTPSFDRIKASGKIFSSGGGLGSAIYCSPLHKDNRVHNLFEQYLYFQLPRNTDNKITALCIEIFPKQKINPSHWGVDYTLFGKIHCEAWESLKLHMDSLTVDKFEEMVYNQIINNLEIINTFLDYHLDKIGNKKFEELYTSLFERLPSLRFILYEVLAEYILLYQNNDIAGEYSIRGELYNLPHKKTIADLCPSMLKKFNIANFFIPLRDLIQYFHRSKIFNNFGETHFLNLIKWRIGFYLKKISGSLLRADVKNFSELIKEYPYLVGQVIYREFFDKNLFEKERAKIIYRLWEKERIICPIYSILPKGEVGINPCLNEMNVDYKIYNTKFNPTERRLEILEELNIKLEPEMVDKSQSVVR